jgi:hypothetical protein
MRINRLWAVPLLLVAAVAIAQVGGNGAKVNGQFTGQRIAGVSISDTSTRVLRVDASGNLLTAESNPLSSQASGFLLLVDDTTAVGMADSSAVQTAYPGYVVHGFWVRVQAPAGRATPYVRMAMQVRTHLNGTADSVSTGAVQLRRAAGGQTTATDTLSIGQVGAPTAVALGPDEVPVTISRSDAVAAKWAVGPMQYIPVALSNGDAVRLPNFSVRFRNLDSGATGGTARITVYAYCTALR